jgi:hypothetical protein
MDGADGINPALRDRTLSSTGYPARPPKPRLLTQPVFFSFCKLLKASFQRFQRQKPDDFSSGFAGPAVRTGLEPATLGVTGRYSNQLNYRTRIALQK